MYWNPFIPGLIWLDHVFKVHLKVSNIITIFTILFTIHFDMAFGGLGMNNFQTEFRNSECIDYQDHPLGIFNTPEIINQNKQISSNHNNQMIPHHNQVEPNHWDSDNFNLNSISNEYGISPNQETSKDLSHMGLEKPELRGNKRGFSPSSNGRTDKHHHSDILNGEESSVDIYNSKNLVDHGNIWGNKQLYNHPELPIHDTRSLGTQYNWHGISKENSQSQGYETAYILHEDPYKKDIFEDSRGLPTVDFPVHLENINHRLPQTSGSNFPLDIFHNPTNKDDWEMSLIKIHEPNHVYKDILSSSRNQEALHDLEVGDLYGIQGPQLFLPHIHPVENHPFGIWNPSSMNDDMHLVGNIDSHGAIGKKDSDLGTIHPTPEAHSHDKPVLYKAHEYHDLTQANQQEFGGIEPSFKFQSGFKRRSSKENDKVPKKYCPTQGSIIQNKHIGILESEIQPPKQSQEFMNEPQRISTDINQNPSTSTRLLENPNTYSGQPDNHIGSPTFPLKGMAKKEKSVKESFPETDDLKGCKDLLPNLVNRVRKSSSIPSMFTVDPIVAPFMKNLQESFIKLNFKHRCKSEEFHQSLKARLEHLTHQFLSLQLQTTQKIHQLDLSEEIVNSTLQEGYEWLMKIWGSLPVEKISFSTDQSRKLAPNKTKTFQDFLRFRVQNMGIFRTSQVKFSAWLLFHWILECKRSWYDVLRLRSSYEEVLNTSTEGSIVLSRSILYFLKN
ncbi:uncharacterized protein MELLADRAFT_69100 [Melampsora larici-populina 98AG31]|uniref:Uncharacterized protein n=1 Tax=Melampsora larici-populina (strain 98AG31 / pathotype 3-4-7) TaxID=747676 RepID=F4S9E1_MELLP|nr:uncharacterized protein MELLADRAFT_69100 [Melampsora larici-populina 98AG31]EGF98744.1 hypothetical protein MELLADRAFT_69100 [Melampsora larici-populina 98AG31]